MPGVRLFLASFLVLFVEIALIRWMPAYIRLLSYFSNFILLASFLGIGLGCLLAGARRDLFLFFPALQAALVAAVSFVRLEVAVASSTSIYFSSGISEKQLVVESTTLLPVLFVVVGMVFAALAQRMGRAMAALPPLRAYLINLAGSLAGVATFALMSSLELPPTVWFGVASAVALVFVADAKPLVATVNVALLAVSLILVHSMARGSLWSPYYRITVYPGSPETVVAVNNIFHQSMAPLDRKEYFYQWPYAVFGDRFDDVLILGAGTGTDVAAALRHGAKRVDAVEIDPVILRLGREKHPARPYGDPRVNLVNDDARHFLRTTERRYDLVVFALIDSLTLQSSFSSVRLESYMFTEESFRAVRDHLKPNGLVVLYNYFRQKWLIDRLANTAAAVFGSEPRGHVQEEHTYLAVLMAGPRLRELTTDAERSARVPADGQPNARSPGRPLVRDPAVAPATDDWPFLYMRTPHLPRHYASVLAVVLLISLVTVPPVVRHTGGRWSWHFFFLGAGFMLLETKSIIQFALLWGSTWSSASLAIISVLTMALASTVVVTLVEIRHRGIVTAALVGLLVANYVIPVGRVAFDSRAAESVFYGLLVFSPVFCAGLLFGSSMKRSDRVASDFGANLLGAMAGGVAEYLALVAGYQSLLVVVGLCYVAALLTRRTGRAATYGMAA